MCYAKYHEVNKFSLEKLLMLTNSFILTVRGCDTLRPLVMLHIIRCYVMAWTNGRTCLPIIMGLNGHLL